MKIKIVNLKTQEVIQDEKLLQEFFDQQNTDHGLNASDIYRFEKRTDGTTSIRDFGSGLCIIPEGYEVQQVMPGEENLDKKASKKTEPKEKKEKKTKQDFPKDPIEEKPEDPSGKQEDQTEQEEPEDQQA